MELKKTSAHSDSALSSRYLRSIKYRDYPFKYEAQTALFKDPVRTAQ